ncbi:MAG: FHA domain-containing protein [Phycisphaerae bacterium]|nr:FHA domain-containing protein [Phycisphaerae bacterium]
MDVKLVVFKPNGQRKDFALPKDHTVIGRGEDCELQVPLANVSRRHCELTVEGTSLKAADLGSSNGTFVNNERIVEKTLQAGDRLVVGPVAFTVQIDGQPENVQQVKTRGQKMAEAGEGEGIVDLEADVVSQGDEGDGIDLAAMADDASEQDADPISALEALASKSDKKKEDGE